MERFVVAQGIIVLLCGLVVIATVVRPQCRAWPVASIVRASLLSIAIGSLLCLLHTLVPPPMGLARLLSAVALVSVMCLVFITGLASQKADTAFSRTLRRLLAVRHEAGRHQSTAPAD